MCGPVYAFVFNVLDALAVVRSYAPLHSRARFWHSPEPSVYSRPEYPLGVSHSSVCVFVPFDSQINGIISTGKEANVYHALGGRCVCVCGFAFIPGVCGYAWGARECLCRLCVHSAVQSTCQRADGRTLAPTLEHMLVMCV